MEPGADPSRHWSLEPGVVFLNHGSYGACPRPVLEAQSEWRQRIERQPVRFFLREWEPALDEVRQALATFLRADPSDLALLRNATQAVNTVLSSLPLRPGDELLTTDHAYGACRNALEAVAERTGARVVVAQVPFPLDRPDQVRAAVAAAVTPRTRLALIDHVTSPTGLVFPIERIVADLRAAGVETLVDGAHAPGMLPLDLRALGAAYYTGNLHKWLCTPKGAAFLHVRRDRKERVRPLSISHGATSSRTDRSRFEIEFGWTGTDDPTPWLAIPSALRFLDDVLPGGIDAVRARNRGLALEASALLCDVLDIPPPAPPEMIGSLAAVPLPDSRVRPESPLFLDALQDALWLAHRIEVPVQHWPLWPKRVLRVSCQLYNRRSDLDALAGALGPLLEAERRAAASGPVG